MAVADDQGTLPAGSPEATFLIMDLGDLGGGQSAALGMNDQGLVVGWSEVTQAPTTLPYSLASDANQRHAFLWDGRKMVDLGDLGGGFSEARDINDCGDIVGLSTDLRGELRAALWFEGQIYDLNDRILTDPVPAPQNAIVPRMRILFEANSISDTGAIVGCGYVYGDIHVHGFILEPQARCGMGVPYYRARDLGQLHPRSDCVAHAVNVFGEAVGMSGRTAFLWRDGEIDPIEDSAPPYIVMSEAMAINHFGDAVGFECGADGRPVACMWRDGQARPLEAPPGRVTVANDLNNRFQSVGWTAKDPDGIREAMIWNGVLGRRLMHVPMDPVGPTHGIVWEILNEATAIDDTGRIAGYGLSTDGRIRAFLLFPDV